MNTATDPNESNESNEPAAEPSSLMGRFVNVFASPGDAFEEIRSAPVRHANWIVPLLLTLLATIGYVVVMFSQPQFVRQVADQQDAALQKQVDAGKMTADQKEQTLKRIQQFTKPAFLMVMGSFGASMVVTVLFFVVVLLLWLLGITAFKPSFGFLKAMEITGLATLINVLGTLVAAPLMVLTGRMNANLSPALFLSNYEVTNKLHACLSAIDVFAIWFAAVLAIGLAKISLHPIAKAMTWVFLLWIVLRFGSILLMPSWD